MTHASSELALCLINENTDRFPYQTRCDLARQPHSIPRFVKMCFQFAEFHERRYGTMKFKRSDVFAAAHEIAGYYKRHVAEIAA